MFYIIGGAARSGKSMIAKRMLVEKQVSYFPMDAFISSMKGAEGLGISHSMPHIEKSESVWRLVGYLFDHLSKSESKYLVEGDSLLPFRIHEFLQDRNKGVIRVCFMGYPRLSSEEKFNLVREYQKEGDWTARRSDESLMENVDRMVEYSKYLKSECDKYGIKFFDVSDDFLKTQEEVFEFLTEAK